jgi:probable FeS assembly SUF system protein SufT
MYGKNSEVVTLKRDCNAVAVPVGNTVVLPADTEGFITQALGGSYTLYVMGNLYRIAGDDADALGKEPTASPELSPDATDEDIERLVWAQMETCFDPEIPVNIVDLGLVYACRVRELENGARGVFVKMTLTAPGCGMGAILVEDVKSKIEKVPTVERADVELVFDPPWNPSMMSEAAKLQTGIL